MLVLGDRKLDPKTDYNGVFADPAAFAKKVHLLWIGVGTAEPEQNARRTPATCTHSLLEANIQHVFYESPGTDHEWQTWRRDLKDFAPRLFLTKPPARAQSRCQAKPGFAEMRFSTAPALPRESPRYSARSGSG